MLQVQLGSIEFIVIVIRKGLYLSKHENKSLAANSIVLYVELVNVKPLVFIYLLKQGLMHPLKV